MIIFKEAEDHNGFTKLCTFFPVGSKDETEEVQGSFT